MTDPPCEHRVITTWTSDNATVAMWACAECSRRFYPACSVCVSVGHRNIVHQPAAPAEGLREALERCIDAMDIVRDGLAVKSADAVVISAESILRHAAREARAALTPEEDHD